MVQIKTRMVGSIISRYSSFIRSIMGVSVMSLSLGACATGLNAQKVEQSPNFKDGKFINTEPFPAPSFGKTVSIFKRFMFEERVNGVPTLDIPLKPILANTLNSSTQGNETAIYRLGHSTLLLELDGGYWLTDPVFSERASPVQWAGPKRFHPTPIALEALPHITGVIISHDHYDHLDKDSIKRLHEKVDHFYVPLGVGQYLQDWGVPVAKIHEFDWWEEKQIGNVMLVSTPANHFSGRGLFDGNETLWSSWVIKTPHQSLYFSGDSGYFSGFKDIGERYGPFDVTLMENGAYDASWKHVHMTPEESVQAHLDLQGEVLFPIHNGTFELAFHPWTEPFERIKAIASAHGKKVATPIMGERWSLKDNVPELSWWQEEAPRMSVESAASNLP